MPVLVTTDRFFRRLHARRGRVRPNLVLSGAEALAAASKQWRSGSGGFYRGTDVNAATERTIAIGQILTDGVLPESFDVDLLAALETVCDSTSVVGAIAARFGMARAIEVKVRSLEFGSGTVSVDERTYAVASLRTGGAICEPGNAHLAALRSLLCDANDDDYEAGREAALALRATTGLTQRAALSFVFPEEPGWAGDDLRVMLTAPPARANLQTFGVLFGSVDDPELLRQWISKVHTWAAWYVARYVCDTAFRLSPADASDVLGALLTHTIGHRRVLPEEYEALGTALCALQTLGAGHALAPQILHPSYGRWARDWLRLHGALAPQVLAAQAKQKSVLGDVSRRVLASLEPKAPVVESTAVLAPWLREGARATLETPDLALPRPPIEGKFPWNEGERERSLSTIDQKNDVRPMTDEMLARWRALPAPSRPVDVWAQWENGKWVYCTVPDADSLTTWNTEPLASHRYPVLHMLAKHGDAAFPGLHARDELDALIRIRAPAIAMICARSLRSLARRRTARAWLRADPEMSAAGLLPFAFSGLGRKKRDAENALRFLAGEHRAAILAVAARFGEAALGAITTWLDRDLLDLAESERVKRRTLHLPRLHFRDRTALPESAVRRILQALRMTAPIAADRRLVELRDTLDPSSRDEFAFAVFCEWAMAGGTSASSWLTFVVPWFGTSTTLRRVWPFLRHWSLHSGKRGAIVLDALEASDQEESLALVARIAEGKVVEPLRIVAREVLDDAARRRGITTLDLLDRLAPTFGAGDAKAIELDLGSRVFRLALADDLTPTLIGPDGRVLSQLPRPNKDDNCALAAAAAERWRWIAAEAKAAALTQTRRLERAMVTGQRWTREAFMGHLLRHPFLSILARRLVWKSGALTFRVAEDGAITSADDRTIELPPGEVVLPHPLQLDPELIGTWSEVFADYTIVQPFEQLGRAIFEMTATQRNGKTIDSAVGRVVPALRFVATLDALGWGGANRGKTTLRTKTGGTAYTYVAMTPGYNVRALASAKPQTLGVLTLYGASTFDEIGDIDLSELLRGVDLLR
ncbi:hypothetical protein BH09MYX1_BH09MYX1_15400 [soil metagenome]